MAYYVRIMGKADVPVVTEIDREAFPTQWPSVNYQHELQNRLAHHIVACDDEKIVAPPKVQVSSATASTGLVARLRRVFGQQPLPGKERLQPARHCVVGFVGLWVLADEAHITSIAVREACRRQGVGELLLSSAIDLAADLKADVVTLEVRLSNNDAQQLYIKYGFTQVGLRRGYYTDNREDAVLMSTPNITSADFQVRLQQLRQAYPPQIMSRQLAVADFLGYGRC